MDMANERTALGAEMPEGARFIGPLPGAEPRWPVAADAPTTADLSSCVACGLCLPHCPTYRVTGEESASPRGRVAAMRAVHFDDRPLDADFTRFMDLCVQCRACEAVCPSSVPFGHLMEGARQTLAAETGYQPRRRRLAYGVL